MAITTAPPHPPIRPEARLRHVGPNWFASVMGTGIVANAAASLPGRSPALLTAATVVWALAALMLLTLIATTAVQWIRRRDTPPPSPVMAQFWGAPPMALMTVGGGAVLLGQAWLGPEVALAVGWFLWTVGTLFGLAVAVWIPFRMMTGHEIGPESPFGGWLMPVVPPMVSAANGALLVPHLPAGDARLSMILVCAAMFGISLLATVIILPLVWQRLVQFTIGPATMVPTLWIVLGPLGQSVTAANGLAGVAAEALPEPYGAAAAAVGVFYGVPVWGFAMFWLVLAAALTLRTARERLPFALTWWSFTFPLGTVVTGTSALAAHLPAQFLATCAVGLYVLLVCAWATVLVRTLRGTWTGAVFPPRS